MTYQGKHSTAGVAVGEHVACTQTIDELKQQLAECRKDLDAALEGLHIMFEWHDELDPPSSSPSRLAEARAALANGARQRKRDRRAALEPTDAN